MAVSTNEASSPETGAGARMNGSQPSTRLYFHSEAVDDIAKWPSPCIPESDSEKANLIGSLCADGSHMPALDIDLPCSLVPSTTEGHFHMYIDKPMSFMAYKKLVAAFIEAGIVEPNIMKYMEMNGMTTLRPAKVKKKPRSPSSGDPIPAPVVVEEKVEE
jgi:hypothetical protein